MNKNIKIALMKSGKSLWKSIPVLIGTLMLISLIQSFIPSSFYVRIFNHGTVIDSLVGTIIGSISAGNPLTSYVIGGELLKQNISLFAITAFLVSWVTVGLLQLPAESVILGKDFAIKRNVSAFLLAILVAMTTVFIYKIIL